MNTPKKKLRRETSIINARLINRCCDKFFASRGMPVHADSGLTQNIQRDARVAAKVAAYKELFEDVPDSNPQQKQAP